MCLVSDNEEQIIDDKEQPVDDEEQLTDFMDKYNELLEKYVLLIFSLFEKYLSCVQYHGGETLDISLRI